MNPTLAAAQVASVPGDIAANTGRHLRFASQAADKGVRLIVFPELSLTGYELNHARGCALTPDSLRLDPLRNQAVRRNRCMFMRAKPESTHDLRTQVRIAPPVRTGASYGGDPREIIAKSDHNEECLVIARLPGPEAKGDSSSGAEPVV